MAEQLRSFLRLKQVKTVTGLSRSWIYDAIRRGKFRHPFLYPRELWPGIRLLSLVGKRPALNKAARVRRQGVRHDHQTKSRRTRDPSGFQRC